MRIYDLPNLDKFPLNHISLSISTSICGAKNLMKILMKITNSSKNEDRDFVEQAEQYEQAKRAKAAK